MIWGNVARSFLSGVSAFGLIGTAHAASGQVEPLSSQTETAESNLQSPEIVVTGSRLRSPNLSSPSPVVSVLGEESALRGVTSVEQTLNTLPQAVAGTGAGRGIGGGNVGTATPDLRGLGPTRTLVLVNGKRLLPGDPLVVSADLNNVPAGLVERVDVLTGGASAVYGSDAAAGVVNFILKRNFKGLMVDGQFKFFNHDQHSDVAQQALRNAPFFVQNPQIPKDYFAKGKNYDASILGGLEFAGGRGNVTGFVSAHYNEGLTYGDVDYGSCLLITVTPANLTRDCQGNDQSFFGRINGVANNPNGTKTFVPYTPSLKAELNPFLVAYQENTRYNAAVTAHLDVSDAFKPYLDLLYTNDYTRLPGRPAGIFDGTAANAGRYTVNCDNPLLGPSQATAICGAAAGTNATRRPSIEYTLSRTPTLARFRRNTYQGVMGVKGDLSSSWDYDAYIQYGRASIKETRSETYSRTRIANALNVVSVGGVPTCVSRVNGSDPSCVPLDIFVANGAGITDAARQYISGIARAEGFTSELVGNASVSGDLGGWGIRSPFSAEGPQVAIGAEYRKDKLSYQPDSVYRSGDLIGQAVGSALAAGPTSGEIEYREIFGELRVPLVSKVRLINELSVEGGARYTDPRGNSNYWTYKLAGVYSPIPELRLRGSYNKAVRTPNVRELFAPTSFTNAGATPDQCAGTTPIATLAQCANTGVTAAQYGQITQCPGSGCLIQIGGNPAIKPETANSLTYGGTVSVGATTLSVDFYRIKIKGLIGAVGGGTAFRNCLSGVDPFFCGLIVRNPTTGNLFGDGAFIIGTNTNTGFATRKGLDIATSTRLPLDNVGLIGLGTLKLNASGSWLFSAKSQTLPGLPVLECVGLYGFSCPGTSVIKWRHQARLTWDIPKAPSLSLNWRHFDGLKLDALEPDPALQVRGATFSDVVDARQGSRDYFDLAVNWDLSNGIAMRAGVNNIFDRDPPIRDAGTFNFAAVVNTSQVYDLFGRQVFVAMSVKLW